MLELNELRQLEVFSESGTLTEAAKKLHLSQPALTRNMKQLEQVFGVPLFLRKKNHLELNENGLLALSLAKKLLREADALIESVRSFDRHSKTLSVGLCAPAPIYKLRPFIAELFPKKTLNHALCDEPALLQKLLDGSYNLVVTSFPPAADTLSYVRFEREQLILSIPQGHRLSDRKSVSFRDIDGETMLELTPIGFWHEIDRKMMPKTRFITLDSDFNFAQLVTSSSLLSFTSSLVLKHLGSIGDRIDIPITGSEATATYYLVCRQEDEKIFSQLFSMVKI